MSCVAGNRTQIEKRGGGRGEEEINEEQEGKGEGGRQVGKKIFTTVIVAMVAVTNSWLAS